MMFLKRLLSFGRLIKRERFIDMNLEGTCLDKIVESFEYFSIGVTVICVDRHCVRRIRNGIDAVGIRNPAIDSDRRQSSVGRFPAGRNESSVDALLGKLTSRFKDSFLLPPVYRYVGSDAFCQFDSVLARSDSKNASAHSLRK